MSEKQLPSSENELSKVWQDETRAYVKALNQFVEKGLREGWESAGEPPEDTRGRLASSVLEMVRRANVSGDTSTLRERFPPAHSPFIEMLDENGQNLGPIALLEDGRIAMRVGTPYEEGKVVVIDGLEVSDSPDFITFGRGPNRRYFAVVRAGGVSIQDGWDGPVVSSLRWPTGLEGIPEGYDVKPWDGGMPTVTSIVPFPDGRRALLVSPEGIFVLTEGEATRLHPTADAYREHFDWLKKEYPDDDLSMDLSMDHGAVSHDGKWISVGSQASKHLIFNDKYEMAGEVGSMSEYPHFTAFSADDSVILCNSCHFYNGISIGVPVRLLPGLDTEPYEENARLPTLEDGARVYAAAAHGDMFVIGDASGYLRAFDLTGKFLWQHFIGSSMSDIDISPDGKRLIATTYAGFLSIIDLDTGETDPYQVGTTTHRERRRWLFWKKEPRPLVW